MQYIFLAISCQDALLSFHQQATGHTTLNTDFQSSLINLFRWIFDGLHFDKKKIIFNLGKFIADVFYIHAHRAHIENWFKNIAN